MTVSACAHGPLASYLPPASPATADIDYLAEALRATPAKREELWAAESARRDDDERSKLRQALLRSVPGHSGYAPGVAHRQLQELRDSSPNRGVAAIAAVRMSAIQEHWEYQRQISALEKKLSRIADIERALETDDE